MKNFLVKLVTVICAFSFLSSAFASRFDCNINKSTVLEVFRAIDAQLDSNKNLKKGSNLEISIPLVNTALNTCNGDCYQYECSVGELIGKRFYYMSVTADLYQAPYNLKESARYQVGGRHEPNWKDLGNSVVMGGEKIFMRVDSLGHSWFRLGSVTSANCVGASIYPSRYLGTLPVEYSLVIMSR